ncbi:YceK/YidQ family lipoprotein [Pseudomonas sp. NPDC087358]|uniref:YceK/YidQ family lipoprotein n=1 Tax=Pseudomonas sp. NPDC087358 TaxID=3364439 RepID=UPI00384CB2B5
MKIWIAGCLVSAISGCGTIVTLSNEKGAANELASWHSNCQTIPRVYSGLAYEFCTLNGPERHADESAASAAAFDLVLSGIADTLVIPYTGYQQYQLGNIQVRRKQSD